MTATGAADRAVQLDRPDGGRRAAGSVRVANEVVAWIAALAALDVEGVHALHRPGSQHGDRLLRRTAAHRGIRLRFDEERRLTLDAWIVMGPGASVPAVGPRVQQGIAQAIERMLDLKVAAVNVFVSEVVFS